jgi:hypothetical protein
MKLKLNKFESILGKRSKLQWFISNQRMKARMHRYNILSNKDYRHILMYK